MYTVGSLFAGIGGLELGLEATGKFKTVWQVERDPYATKVLKKHWPDVPRHDDVCTFPPETGKWDCDLICGGFPCQDISFAGKGAGLAGERSGLFYEGIRIIDRLRPRWVLLENVTALLVRGLDDVLRELAKIGYNAEWHCVPAAAIGAHHRRDRIFIMANAARVGRDRRRETGNVFKTDGRQIGQMCAKSSGTSATTAYLANTNGAGLEGHRETGSARQVRTQKALSVYRSRTRGQWASIADVCRVANGVSDRIHRIRCLGNAVVPQVAQFMGEIILDRMGENERIH